MAEHELPTENSSNADESPGRVKTYRQRQIRPRSLLANLFILTGLVLTGLFVGQLIGMSLAQLTSGVSLNQMADLVQHPSRYPGAWSALMWLQAGASLGGFVGAPLLFWLAFEHRRLADFNASAHTTAPTVWPLVFLLVVLAMPFNGWIYEMNQRLDLPSGLQGLEDWMKSKESGLEELTKFLTGFSSIGQLLVGLLVVAVIPAVGEELLFRGVLQNLFRRAFGNVHVAVWLSAAIFSGIHFQFYGFLPRMLLGAMFGYLYVWTRHLGVAMFAHFINNGATLVMVYLFRQQILDYDIERTDSVPLLGAALSLAVAALLMWTIYRQAQTEKPIS
ncbi:MAG: CPBP family intramembrane metalloprotease [Cytophagaceae bacterium]|nr:CPBP family intramembrane metalloprotease [Cytophagaceae bacterium]